MIRSDCYNSQEATMTQKKDLKRGNAKKRKKKYGIFCD